MDYGALQSMVAELLETFGSISVLRVTTGRVVDTTTGAVTVPGTTTDYDVRLVVLPATSRAARALDALGVAPRFGQRRLVMSCAVRPAEGDLLWLVERGAGAWRALGPVEPTAPDMLTDVVYHTVVSL